MSSDNSVLRGTEAPVSNAVPLEFDSITEELANRAKCELFEDENTRIRSLEALRSMLRDEKDLRWQDDDLFLLAFLRARKYDVKRAFELVKGLYAIFGKHEDLYYNFSFDEVKNALDENALYYLPYRASGGAIVMIIRIGKWKPEASRAEVHLLCATIGAFHSLLFPASQIAGMKMIVDFKGFTLKQLLHLKLSHLSLFVNLIQSSIPLRLRGLHVVNENHLISYISTVLKQLFTKKMQERIHFHGKNFETLHKFILPKILPAEYGGEQPPYDNTDWREKLEAYTDYIKHVFTFGYQNYLLRAERKKSIGG